MCAVEAVVYFLGRVQGRIRIENAFYTGTNERFNPTYIAALCQFRGVIPMTEEFSG
jgi:hypothetical protein